MADPWTELEGRLVQINSISMPKDAAIARARHTLGEVRSGSIGMIDSIRFSGPKTFLRVAGAANRVYGGEWWFDESLLQRVQKNYSRIYFGQEKVQAVRKSLREALALATTWNNMTEIWALNLPAGETLPGYQSQARAQSLFHGLPVSPANRMLAGGATQIFFPVKNPLWVIRYGSLA